MLLETRNLTKTYRGFLALDDLNLQIGAGEIFGLLGPNGSGKSTTLRLLMGFLRPTRGQARIGGHDCWSESVAVRRLVAYLPGELRLYENLTGRQLLSFLASLRNQTLDAQGEQLARRFDIDLERPITKLSSGMKRKLALLQVLLPRTPLLILDEPTNTLDPTMRDELLDQLLLARRQGQTILFSSHVLQEVERVCDRVGILERGRLVHVQEMQSLREARTATVRFAEHDRPAALTRLPAGLDLVEQGDGLATFRVRGDLHPLLNWLAGHRVADLRLEPMGLSQVYRRFHGDQDAVAAPPGGAA